MKEMLKKVRAKLASQNYKFTLQRELILEILFKNKGKHLSAEDIYTIVKENDPSIGLATVYRTLELFCELDIIKQLDFDDNCRRYEIGTEDSHHHHLICIDCDVVIEFNDDLLEDFETNLENKHDFKTTEHSIKFYGYCNECN